MSTKERVSPRESASLRTELLDGDTLDDIPAERLVPLTFRTPSEGDPRIFPWAFFVRTAPPTSGMLASPERRYTKRLHPGRVLWVSCYRPSKRTKSNICPL